MLQRSSYVNYLNSKSVSFSSIIQLGDSVIINGLTRALAVQREVDIFFGNEGSFAAYPIFSEPIPLLPITEDIAYRFHHLKPIIKVNKIDIIGISASSLLHVGNSQNIYMEARVEHVRQLLPRSAERPT